MRVSDAQVAADLATYEGKRPLDGRLAIQPKQFVDVLRDLQDARAEIQRLRAKAVGISDEPLSSSQMARAVARSEREGWKDIQP